MYLISSQVIRVQDRLSWLAWLHPCFSFPIQRSACIEFFFKPFKQEIEAWPLGAEVENIWCFQVSNHPKSDWGPWVRKAMWPWRHSPWERVQKARSKFWCRCDAMQHWGKATLTSAILVPQDPSGLSSTANQSEEDSQKELDTKQWDVSTATDRAEGWWTLSGTDTPARRGSLLGCLTAVTKHSGRWLLGCWSTDNLRESWYQQQTLERLMAYYTKIHIFSLSGPHIINFSLISRWWGEQPAVERKRQCLKITHR